eukprot:2955595-Prymnesium_polylepis.1
MIAGIDVSDLDKLHEMSAMKQEGALLRDEVGQLRRVVAMLTPGLHSQELPWSPRLEPASSPAVVYADRVYAPAKAVPNEDGSGGGGGAAPRKAGGVVGRMLEQAETSAERWARRRERLATERVRATEAAMQAHATVHYSGGAFAEMHSLFDEGAERPRTADGADPALPPIRPHTGGGGGARPLPIAAVGGAQPPPQQQLKCGAGQ